MPRHQREKAKLRSLDSQLSVYVNKTPMANLMMTGLDDIISESSLPVAVSVEVDSSNSARKQEKSVTLPKAAGHRKGGKKGRRLQHTYGNRTRNADVKAAVKRSKKLLRSARRYKQVSPLQRVELRHADRNVLKLRAEHKRIQKALKDSAKKIGTSIEESKAAKSKPLQEQLESASVAKGSDQLAPGQRPNNHTNMQRHSYNQSKGPRHIRFGFSLPHGHMPARHTHPAHFNSPEHFNYPPHFSSSPAHYPTPMPPYSGYPAPYPQPHFYGPPSGYGPSTAPYFSGYTGHFAPPPTPPPPPPPPYYPPPFPGHHGYF